MKFDLLVESLLNEQFENDDFYLRFGNLPNKEFSRIGRSSKDDTSVSYEKGISCFWARWSNELQRWMIWDADHDQIASLQDISDRPIYLIKGEEVGYGSDGEPVLKKNTIKILAKLNPNDVYHDDLDSLDHYPRLSKPEPQWEDLDKKVKFIQRTLKNFDNEQNKKTGSGLLDFYRTELSRIRDEYIKRSREWAKTHVLKSNVSPNNFK